MVQSNWRNRLNTNHRKNQYSEEQTESCPLLKHKNPMTKKRKVLIRCVLTEKILFPPVPQKIIFRKTSFQYMTNVNMVVTS